MAHDGSFDAQHAARLSAGELQQLTRELFNWSKDAKKKAASKGLAAEAAPPASGAAGQNAATGSTQQQQPENNTARHPAAHTYDNYRNKWDKFDVDAALAEEEDEGHHSGGAVNGASSGSEKVRRSSSSSGYGGSTQPMAIPKAHVTVTVGPSPLVAAADDSSTPEAAGGVRERPAPATAESWKDAGNEHFKHGRYRQAIEAYTASLEVHTSCLAFANRAMARLKLGQHELSEEDCSEALKLDPMYVKAYQRRAIARRQLGNLLGAVEDVEAVLRLEPNNKQAAADRADWVRQLLHQQGLQPPSRREELPLQVAPVPSKLAGAGGGGAAAVEPSAAAVTKAESEPAAAGDAEAGAAGEDGDVLIKVSSVRRPTVEAVAAGIASGIQPQGQLSGVVPEQQLAPITPAASIQMLDGDDGEESMPDLAEPPAAPLPQQQQAMEEVCGMQLEQPGSSHGRPPGNEPAQQQAASTGAEVPQPQPMDEDQHWQPAGPPPARAELPAVKATDVLAGGIKAADAQAVAVPAPPAPAVQPPRVTTAAIRVAPVVRAPRTGVDFEKAWKGFKGDAQQQAAYLLTLQPAQLPLLLKQALTPGLLAAAALALLGPGLLQRPAAAVALLETLTGVQRFDVNLLSLPARQKAELKAAWDVAQAQLTAADSGSADKLAALRSKFKL